MAVPLFDDDLDETGSAEELPPTPAGFRREWAQLRDMDASMHHNEAQRWSFLKRPSTLETYSFLFKRACGEPHEVVRRRLRELQNADPLWVGLASEVRARLMLQAGDLSQGEGDCGTASAEVTNGSVPAGHILLHAAPAKVGEDRRGRDALREALAKPKRLAGPRTPDEVDRLFAALFAEGPWLRKPLAWAWQRALDSLDECGWFRLPPLLLLGPPGCGKTRMAERLAELAGLPRSRLEGASMTASFPIGGSDFQWNSSHPGEAVRLIHESDVANPLVIFDEVEKGQTSSSGGDPRQALLPFLQRSTAASYRCPYLQAPVDLSHVTWILTANSLEGLSAPLLDRVTLFPVGYPTGSDLERLVIRVLDGLEVDERVVARLTAEIENGRLTLRGLDRLKNDFRALGRRPMLH
ncbi:AAA family ATPase [Cereibacter azotoformans]|uniref:AAA family ATPase n=1 Tax=Cereibacter azotoformans TaxID=43057 RepID=UPI001F40F8EB|nr:AAA family ATPase [Cereibacter azotoformans]